MKQKARYSQPVLTVFGCVALLTAAGTRGSAERGVNSGSLQHARS
jgi:hypothetical protein